MTTRTTTKVTKRRFLTREGSGDSWRAAMARRKSAEHSTTVAETTIQHLKVFHGKLESRLRRNLLLESIGPSAALIGSKDSMLLNNLDKKVGRPQNYQKKWLTFHSQAKSLHSINDTSV